MVMAADEIAAIVARGRAAFDDDVVLRRPIERCLEIMGEASQTVSREFVAAHVEIPWSDMAKVRDRLSHHYQVIEIAHDGFSGVLIDHFAGGVQVGRYLTARGHRRLAYLGHRQDHDYQSQSRQKLAGFSSVLDEAPLVREIDNDFAHAVNAALELFDSPARPTAILAHDDLLAAGALRAAAMAGLSVPEDVAVIGFNDTDLAEPLGLTTVRQPFEESGELAVKILDDQIADPDIERRTISLSVSLIERRTA